VTRRGTTNRDARGSTANRLARRRWLLAGVDVAEISVEDLLTWATGGGDQHAVDPRLAAGGAR
jgi:hypothetical protein